MRKMDGFIGQLSVAIGLEAFVEGALLPSERLRVVRFGRIEGDIVFTQSLQEGEVMGTHPLDYQFCHLVCSVRIEVGVIS